MRVFGHIQDVSVGDIFENRIELAKSGIHPPTQAGISGGAKEGADSIVLSGGYEDDEDFGDEIIYTGAGGRDENTGKQIADQKLERTNLALAKNSLEGLPVRVTRSAKHPSHYSPTKGYQYAGLYRVVDYWYESGLSGFKVWRYRLVSHDRFGERVDEIRTEHPDYLPTLRTQVTVQRLVRDTNIAQKVKALYDYRCQVCGLTIETGVGRYAEAAHIKPLGQPHCGPDVEENILCLCPNHHVMFDHGAFSVADDLSLIGIDGQLTTNKTHKIGIAFITYHREHYFKSMLSLPKSRREQS
ncbi:HNH endonuclease [Vibrio furnissii]|uniref:YDG/SRA domain-containing protein n=1 Tax=Vibrio furnissii TaxID=29494 RepID=UPI00130246D5|nr:YDG/SRA domain-containing protein [Vibrio furnissii]MCG6211347.1 HNH endonuclease [Vibrio furnissii]